ncbi:MAG: signal peptidase II [Hyphomonadaceae bacterium]|nr:signal peptidase II [Hyphomonadaceae bacterium]
MTPVSRMLFAALVTAPVVVVDQWSKFLVLSEPRFKALDCLDPARPCGGIEISAMFDLTMLWNRGMSFGALQSEGVMRWVLVAVTIGIAVGFAVWLTRATRWLTALALALVVGGAIGNVIDRIRFGAVVDFLDFSGIWRPYFFNYVFNVADAAITVGAVLLFLDQFILSRHGSSAPSPARGR